MAVTGIAVAGGTADARTIPVNWTDSQSLWGGHIVYRTTKIWVRGETFSVTASITNETKYPLRFQIVPYNGPFFGRPQSFGLAWREPPSSNIHTRHLHSVSASVFSPGLPKKLAAGRTWKVTFSGRSRLLRTHRTWWVIYGVVSAVPGRLLPPDPLRSFWLSSKTFTT